MDSHEARDSELRWSIEEEYWGKPHQSFRDIYGWLS
jgi:hypothetical protein